MSTLTAKIQLRRDTAANWALNNPILAAGEVAFTSDLFYTSTDQQRFKIGDGVQTWSQLDYVPEGGGGSSYPEHLYLTVVNKTGDNLLASGYKVMKVIDAQGQRLAVDYALADSDSNSADTIGIVFENINDNQEGKLIVVGDLTGLNTTGSLQGETWQDGDLLYLSPTVNGGITKVKPTAPNHGVRLGYVVYAHANQGKIYVKIDNGYEIGELHDCYLPTPTNNDGIFWSSGTTRYENKSITQALGYTPSQFSIFQMYMGTPASTFNPADATAYYFGIPSAPATGTIAFRAVPVTKKLTLKAISSLITVVSTIGSSESSTLDFQVYSQNSVLLTSTNITTSLKFDNASKVNIDNFDNLNIEVPANCLIVLKITTATFVTNPTNIYGTFTLTFN